MKLADIDKVLPEFTSVEEKPGIYCITVNSLIVYVGQSKNLRERAKSHVYYILNAPWYKEHKYKLLHSAYYGGLEIQIYPLKYCEESELKKLEDKYILQLMPMLNIQIPGQKNQQIDHLTIVDILAELYKIQPKYYDERFGIILGGFLKTGCLGYTKDHDVCAVYQKNSEKLGTKN